MARILKDNFCKNCAWDLVKCAQCGEPQQEADSYRLPEGMIATQYQFQQQFNEMELMPITISLVKSNYYPEERWAVRQGAFCLSWSGEWEHEPIPSSRDDAFYGRCRFLSFKSAVDAASRVKNEQTVQA